MGPVNRLAKSGIVYWYSILFAATNGDKEDMEQWFHGWIILTIEVSKVHFGE